MVEEMVVLVMVQAETLRLILAAAAAAADKVQPLEQAAALEARE
jgi:hypothetical protein